LTGTSFEEIFKIDTAGITKINLNNNSVEFISFNDHLNIKDVGVKDSFNVLGGSLFKLIMKGTFIDIEH